MSGSSRFLHRIDSAQDIVQEFDEQKCPRDILYADALIV
jgi:hypothetical protein